MVIEGRFDEGAEEGLGPERGARELRVELRSAEPGMVFQLRDFDQVVVAAPVDALPFADESFDLVTCSWVMEHLADPRRAFAQIARVLAPGGHWVFLTPNARNPLTFANRLMRGPLQARLVRRLYARAESDTFPVLYRANTPARIEQLARQVGLRPVQIQLVGDPTYLAFNDALFTLSSLLERITPQEFRVHIVGDYAK